MQEEMQLMSRCKYSSQHKEVSTQGQALLGSRLEKNTGLNEQLEQMWSVKFNMVCTFRSTPTEVSVHKNVVLETVKS